MLKSDNRKVVSRLIVLALLACCLALFATGTARTLLPALALNPQGPHNRVIEKKKNSLGPDEPVEMTVVKTKQKKWHLAGYSKGTMNGFKV